MSDEAEITALVDRYAILLDAGDIDGVAGLFENATWHSDRSDVVRRGATEVRPVYEQLVAAAGTAGTRHLLTHLVVTVAPDSSSASARCHWTVVAAESDHPTAAHLSGQYVDRFGKVDGRWCFTDRLITTDAGGSPSSAPAGVG
jgi:ketosteroid isomerase-like protein